MPQSLDYHFQLINLMQRMQTVDYMHLGCYSGLELENSFKHIGAFFEICSTAFFKNVSNIFFRLHCFPFSLKDKAKACLATKSNITTWDQMQKKFLKKFSQLVN